LAAPRENDARIGATRGTAVSLHAFDDLSDVYESMIDWPKRLANETPFFRRLFEQVGARSVLDVACGTGHHAAMFHAWGLRVEGADASPGMIARCRARFGEPDRLRFALRSFDQPVTSPEPFDAAICVGNSLALAPDAATAGRAVETMFGAIRPGGAVVVQVLNLWHLPDGPCVWQKSVRTMLPPGETLAIKGVRRCGERGYVDLVLADPAGGPLRHAESVPLLGLRAATLQEMARRAGASTIAFFGDYHGRPYVESASADLVMVACRLMP
jgi:SAM-dependent methyltransferase